MRRAALIAAGIGVLALALLVDRLGCGSIAPATVAERVVPGSEIARPIEPEPMRAYAWVVRDGRRVSGPKRVFALQGDTLRLAVESDADGRLRLHGYDRSVALAADRQGMLELTLERAGSFDAELQGARSALTTLEVLPRERWRAEAPAP